MPSPVGCARSTTRRGPLRADADYKIRLHVWPAGEHRLGESNPHGHRWNFASTVLCGDGLFEIHYKESTTGVPYLRHAYAAGALTPVEEVHLEECDHRKVQTRDRYTVDTSVVHTVQPLGTSLVATLVLQGPTLLDSAPVYCAPGVNVDEPVLPVSADQVRDLVRGVLDSGEFGS